MNNYKVTVSINPENDLSKENADKFEEHVKEFDSDCNGFLLITCHDTASPNAKGMCAFAHDMGEHEIVHAMQHNETLLTCARIAVLCSALGVGNVEIDDSDTPEKGGENNGN